MLARHLLYIRVSDRNGLDAINARTHGIHPDKRRDYTMNNGNDVLGMYLETVRIAKKQCGSMEEVKAWIDELETALDDLSNVIAGFEYSLKEKGEEHE